MFSLKEILNIKVVAIRNTAKGKNYVSLILTR